ncbi:MAG: aminoacyl-tRNA hydrolase [Desulfoplanes sp.]
MAIAGLIVGLGNPGTQYRRTRHNSGFMLLDRIVGSDIGCALLSSRSEKDFELWQWQPCTGHDPWLLLKPLTFMNRSGRAVQKVLKHREIPCDRILVLHDELDLPLGKIRFKKGGGLAGHNGLKSIAAVLGTQEFLRLRIGISRPDDSGDVVSYVLGSFSQDEYHLLASVFDNAVQGIRVYCQDGIEQAMQITHAP